jgi:type III pantothenate kinase
MQVIVADVGNSSIKLMGASLDCEHRSILPSWGECLTLDPAALPASLSLDEAGGNAVSRKCHWYVSSVNSAHDQALRSAATSGGCVAEWHAVTHEFIDLEIDVDHPASTGIDRLLAAQAAFRLYANEQDVIVIDCGTAMTIDVVTGDGTFRGGVILAGPATNLKALSSMTSALPDLSGEKLVRPGHVIGRSTRAAMLSGAYFAGLGSIREVVRQISASLPGTPVVVGTGGGLGPWREELPAEWTIVDHLVIDGLFEVAVERFCERSR